MILAKKSLAVAIALWTSFHVSGAICCIEGSYVDSSFSLERGKMSLYSLAQDFCSMQQDCSVIGTECIDKKIVAENKSPLLIIDSVQFANIDKKGRIIDNYGDQIEGRYVKYLATRISYRAVIPDSPVTLDVKFFNPEGKLMRDADSPEGCSYRVSFRTGSSDEDHLQYLGKLRSKFGKGYRMEIYDEPECLLSISVPTRGMITYVPIMRQTTPSLNMTDEYRRYLKMSPDRRAFVLRDLHMRNYTGPFMDNYVITGWRAVEK